MRLTLTYQGPLPARSKGVTPLKHGIRQQLHPQIKSQIEPLLGANVTEHVSSSYGGFDFVTPVSLNGRTAVELDILLLARRGKTPLGDLDNRMKNLIDGLTRPATREQVSGFEPPDEGPTFCLMEDDQLVQRIGLDTRYWHSPDASFEDALVVVTAKIVLADNADASVPMGPLFFVL